MGDFNPRLQNITFLAADGETEVHVPIPFIDQTNNEAFGVCINYGSQIGACFIMLLMVLFMTPSSKLRRPSNVLHVLALAICLVRMILLAVFFTSPFNESYLVWSGDHAGISSHSYQVSITASVFSLLLAIVVELALMNQAWTMVALWPRYIKYTTSCLSAAIALLTVGWKFAATVVQAKLTLSGNLPDFYYSMSQWVIVTNVVSICWFCALFNAKLIIHLVSNRGILPSYKTLTPMEVLVMTNGVLMIVPVIFSGLEWGHFINFEAASLTLTSVAIILPMGTMAAQRMTQSTSIAFCSSVSNNRGEFPPANASWSGWPSSTTPLKTASFTNSSGTGTMPQVSIMSRCEAGMTSHDRSDPDLELIHIDTYREIAGGRVKVERNLEQRVDRV